MGKQLLTLIIGILLGAIIATSIFIFLEATNKNEVIIEEETETTSIIEND